MAQKLSPELSEGAETDIRSSQKEGPAAHNAKSTQVLGSTFLLDRRYEILARACREDWGIFAAAQDTVTGNQVAIKKIDQGLDDPILAKRILRELKFLRLIKHENIISISTIQLPTSKQELDEIYVVSELMENSLAKLLKSNQALSDDHRQYFVYQTLRGVKVLHGLGVVHRELKPLNLVFKSNCDLRIRNFRFARVDLPTPDFDDALSIGTWYRSPEFLLGDHKYTKAMDMWSVGCILGELLLRRPIFPGTNPVHQLELIFDLLGTPSDEDIQSLSSTSAPSIVDRLPMMERRDLSQVFPDANPLALDLLERLLQCNPAKRITVEDAIRHPYLSRYHIEDGNPSVPPLSVFDFLYESESLNVSAIRELIYEEILLYHIPAKSEEYERNKAVFEAERRGKEPPATPTISESSTGSEHGEV